MSVEMIKPTHPGPANMPVSDGPHGKKDCAMYKRILVPVDIADLDLAKPAIDAALVGRTSCNQWKLVFVLRDRLQRSASFYRRRPKMQCASLVSLLKRQLQTRSYAGDANGLSESYCDFNNIRVRSFILTGAPFPYLDSIPRSVRKPTPFKKGCATSILN